MSTVLLSPPPVIRRSATVIPSLLYDTIALEVGLRSLI
jgi:hypothetical protein